MKESTWYALAGAVVGGIGGVSIVAADYLWDGESWTVLASTVNVPTLMVTSLAIAAATVAWATGLVNKLVVYATMAGFPTAMFAAFVTGWVMPLVTGLAKVLGLPFLAAGYLGDKVNEAADAIGGAIIKK